MLNLTKQKTTEDAMRVFSNAVKPGANEKGFVIQYVEGNFGDEIGLTKIGKMAWDFYERGLIELVQKKIGFERHLYLGVVK